MTADQTPPNDTGAPEKLGTSRQLVERIARSIEDGDLFAPAMRKPVGAVIRALLDERDLSASREAAAWIAGRDRAADEVDTWNISGDEIRALPIPADQAAALDQLIAEARREGKIEGLRSAVAICKTTSKGKDDLAVRALECAISIMDEVNPQHSKEGRDHE